MTMTTAQLHFEPRPWTACAADIHIEPGVAFNRPCPGCGSDRALTDPGSPVFVTKDRTAVCDTCVEQVDPVLLDALATVRDIDDAWKSMHFEGSAAAQDAATWLRTVAHGVFELFAGHVGSSHADLEAFRGRVGERADELARFREARARIEAEFSGVRAAT